MAEELREFLLRWWNEEISEMLCSAKIRHVSDERLKKWKLRAAEYANLIESIRAEAKEGVSEFAMEKGFLTFDFLMSPSKLLKFLEGNYRDRDKPLAKDEPEPTPVPQVGGGVPFSEFRKKAQESGTENEFVRDFNRKSEPRPAGGPGR